MGGKEERQQHLLEEVRKALEEKKGGRLDPETLARLAAIGGVVEERESWFTGFWRVVRVPALLAMLALLGWLFYLLFSQGQHRPAQPAGPPKGRPGTVVRR